MSVCWAARSASSSDARSSDPGNGRRPVGKSGGPPGRGDHYRRWQPRDLHRPHDRHRQTPGGAAHAGRGVVKSVLRLGLLSVVRLLVGAHADWRGCAPEPRQRIYYANHASHFDTLVIVAALPTELRTERRTQWLRSITGENRRCADLLPW